MRVRLTERDLREIDYDALIALCESAPPATWMVARSLEEAQALAIWIEEFEANDQ